MLTSIPYEVFNFAEFWDTLSTSFVQFEFIFFVFALTALYYIFPMKYRWTVLLAGSTLFYAIAGPEAMITILLTAFMVYLCGMFIEATDRKDRKKRRLFLGVGVTLLLTVLVFVKLHAFLDWDFSLVVPLGISYYTFSSIGYLADIYWGKDRAQRNFFKLALFLLYFPKILQGPIAKHKTLGPQLVEGHAFDYDNYCQGIQLAIWGFFKKMVIGDRIVIFTSSVFGSYEKFGTEVLVLTAVLSAFQLYCDFSGCMDIARGISQMMGIELDRNFDRPFVAKSAGEFWRRWHMSLGAWFKDYVLMPLAINPKLIMFSGAISKKFGKRAGKAVMSNIPTLVVWILTGLWHGTGVNYVAWGLYWATLMITSSVFAPEIAKLVEKLHIDTKSKAWGVFQMVRTFLLFCVGRIISGLGTLEDSVALLTRIFVNPMPWQLFDGTLLNQGLNLLEFVIMMLMVVLLCLVMAWQGKQSIRKTVAGWPMVINCTIYVLAVIFILVFGIYGPDSGAISFAYANF